jgi:hypothetical protein
MLVQILTYANIFLYLLILQLSINNIKISTKDIHIANKDVNNFCFLFSYATVIMSIIFLCILVFGENTIQLLSLLAIVGSTNVFFVLFLDSFLFLIRNITLRS